MAEKSTPLAKPSWLQALLSLLIPGLGQAVGGAISRGFYILLSIVTLSGLAVFAAAQRPRYPDYALSFHAYLLFLAESAALLVFLLAIYWLARRYAMRSEFARNVATPAFVVLVVVALGITAPAMIDTVLSAADMKKLYAMTSLLTAFVTVAIWMWNIFDAARLRGREHAPSMGTFYMLLIVGILVLGTRIVQINPEKAIREYKDTGVILSRIVWPWKVAFDYSESQLVATAKIQAPCPPGSTPPPVEQPKEGQPWVSVTPTCGELSTRDSSGKPIFGTLLTIKGGGFQPNKPVHIQWANPLGNAFTPRGFGPTDIEVGPDGTFTTKLYIPDVTIPSMAQGPQIHELRVVQRGTAKFTGKLSKEMKLALQAMLESIMMGLMATAVGIVLSVPLSFLAARNLMSSLHTTTQGFVGGVIGLVGGAYLGKLAGDWLTPMVGGLEKAPILTFSIYIVLVFGLAIVAYRLLSRALDSMAEHLPPLVSLGVGMVGMALVGAAVGYALGLGYAHGILGITRGTEGALAAAPHTALLGAVLGAFLGAFWAWRLGTSSTIPIGQMIYAAVRLTLNIGRSIEPLIWAIMGVIWVGPGPFAGFIALTIHSVAALGKLYSEAIESIDPGPIEALQATGASRLQTIVYAVVPQVMPPFTAFTLYRWDINVRMSTIIGLVGGGGIGFLLIQWIHQFQYEQAGLAVWLITITVATLDFVSASIREKMV